MNVLFISPAYFPAIGGAETHVRALAEGLVALGHTATVLTDKLHPASPSKEFINDVEILRTSRRHLDSLDRPDRVPWEQALFGLLQEFSQFCAGRRFDLIHAHCQVSALLGAMIKGSLKCPLVISVHDTQPELDPMGEGRSEMIFAGLPYDKLIAGSQFFQSQALQYGATPGRVVLVYYGVDLARFTPKVSGSRVRAKFKLSDDQPLVLLVGRFKARKGMLEFVQAMAQVIDVIPNAQALISGSCHSASLDYLNIVQREIRRLGLAHVVTINDKTLEADEMPELYAAADLVIQPSHAEGFGLAIVEAMAMAKPVIGTNVSGINEIITHGHNGLLVPPQRSDSLARAIIELLSDPDKATQFAHSGYTFVHEHLGLDRMLGETLAVYACLTDHGRENS